MPSGAGRFFASVGFAVGVNGYQSKLMGSQMEGGEIDQLRLSCR